MNLSKRYLELDDQELELRNSIMFLKSELSKTEIEKDTIKQNIVKEYLEDGVLPDNLTVKRVPPKPIIIDKTKIPDAFWRIEREINKSLINKSFKDGKQVDGCVMDNGGYTIAIREINVKNPTD